MARRSDWEERVIEIMDKSNGAATLGESCLYAELGKFQVVPVREVWLEENSPEDEREIDRCEACEVALYSNGNLASMIYSNYYHLPNGVGGLCGDCHRRRGKGLL